MSLLPLLLLLCSRRRRRRRRVKLALRLQLKALFAKPGRECLELAGILVMTRSASKVTVHIYLKTELFIIHLFYLLLGFLPFVLEPVLITSRGTHAVCRLARRFSLQPR